MKLRRELAEAREQQAATAEILEAISSSPTDQYRAARQLAKTVEDLEIASQHKNQLGQHEP